VQSFIYIERYPLNFVRKIFNPYFMDRLHNQQEEDMLLSRTQLKLFDNVMKMESRNYNGPYLPKETNYRTIPCNQQVARLANHLVEPMGDIVGDVSRIGKSVVLSSLPLHPMYIADIMIYPSVAASLLRYVIEIIFLVELLKFEVRSIIFIFPSSIAYPK
jgi:Xaa-Pro dipeptidase